jgi:RimJ/RimL family protein N-acetyltransferase
MFPTEIQTERLRLVRLSGETISLWALYDHMHDDAPHIDEVCRYTKWEPHESVMETHEYLDEVESKWEANEQATYAIYPNAGERDADTFAGVANLNLDWDRRSGELGIWLRKPFWGRGYSGERAAALMELAFEELELELVGASHQVGNEKSKQAIERYVDAHGGQYDGVLRNFLPIGDEVRDLHRYSVSREQYREAKQLGRTESKGGTGTEQHPG